jgi:hypothetical protein
MGSHDDDESTTEVMKRPSPTAIAEDARRRWLLGVLGDLSDDEAHGPPSTTPSGGTPV